MAPARRWPGPFRISYHRVETKGINLLLSNHEFVVSATRTQHFVPTIALRFTWQETGNSSAYSCDTEHSDKVVELTRGAKLFLHEATTLDTFSAGHSSAIQAGEEAKRAGVGKLVLVHLPPHVNVTKWRAAARQGFDGPVVVARDFQEFGF